MRSRLEQISFNDRAQTLRSDLSSLFFFSIFLKSPHIGRGGHLRQNFPTSGAPIFPDTRAMICAFIWDMPPNSVLSMRYRANCGNFRCGERVITYEQVYLNVESPKIQFHDGCTFKKQMFHFNNNKAWTQRDFRVRRVITTNQLLVMSKVKAF